MLGHSSLLPAAVLLQMFGGEGALNCVLLTPVLTAAYPYY